MTGLVPVIHVGPRSTVGRFRRVGSAPPFRLDPDRQLYATTKQGRTLPACTGRAAPTKIRNFLAKIPKQFYLCSHDVMKEKGRMSDKVETAQLAVRPYRSVASQRPARPARARRDRRIIESLNRGVSGAEIAKRENVVEKPTRDPAGQTARSDEAPPARPEMAPQGLEKIESVPGNGMGPETLDPQYLVHGRAADRARLRLTSREKDKVAQLPTGGESELPQVRGN